MYIGRPIHIHIPSCFFSAVKISPADMPASSALINVVARQPVSKLTMEIRKLVDPFVCDMNQAVTENRRPLVSAFPGRLVW